MSTLYYEDETVQLYLGDCREVPEWTAADVLVTDPPYGTEMIAKGKSAHKGGYGRRTLHDKGDGKAAVIANDLTTECRDQILTMWGTERPVLVFGSPRLPDPPGEWDDRLVWDKRRPGINGGPWRYQHETIYVRGFIRAGGGHFSILSAYPSEQHLHIHNKPVPVMEALIECAPEGVIAEPFAGSGSTIIAARNLGRKVIAVEESEQHCETIVKRLKQQAFSFATTAPLAGAEAPVPAALDLFEGM